MKIVWINDYCSFKGGAETYIYETATLLKKKYDVENILLYSVENRVDVKFASLFDFATVIADLKLQLELIKPDIIYVHQVSNANLLKELSLSNFPVIAFIHDHKYFCLREHKYTTLGHKTCTQEIGLGCYSCLGFLNKEVNFPYLSIKTLSNLKKIHNYYKSFDTVIVASQYMKDHLILHNFNEEKISKIPLFSNQQNILWESNLKSKPKRFLFVGQLIRGKGLDTLLKAFANISDNSCVLDICGDGKQRYEYEVLAVSLGLDERVFFHGKIDKDKLDTFYDDAYVIVIPSRAPETFNLVGLEAMKHSKAVIASDVGGIKEWLKEKENGLLFDSNDTKKLQHQLEYALSNEDEIIAMGKNAYKIFQEKFIANNHIETLYNLLETLTQKELNAVL